MTKFIEINNPIYLWFQQEKLNNLACFEITKVKSTSDKNHKKGNNDNSNNNNNEAV